MELVYISKETFAAMAKEFATDDNMKDEKSFRRLIGEQLESGYNGWKQAENLLKQRDSIIERILK